ncbi:hypothetical protein D3273_22160 [Lichenibacterium minor]|uniref:Uncharacterized protein n=1 Tax=Lichenibacterium minor TaxID=2316528 RepID=A0A4Q2U116_9HYPH|nr:hypothetical protein [Lichenibacterium minor]RYC29770.1 hypothetical protein D3273_22160 [Lichenibacterium minor]
MRYSIPGMPIELQKAVGRIGHAVAALPDKHRDPVIDAILDALAAAHSDRETTAYERGLLPQLRERMLSALAASPLHLKLDHDEELAEVAEKDRVARVKQRENILRKRHKQAHMAEAERAYVPPKPV